MVTKQELIDFETDIANEFDSAHIRAPIHLYNGVEEQMIKVFEKVDIKNDWVCATWRNHYQCLLKGVPKELLKQKILNGKSMVMSLPEYKIYCSSIVGGIAPIAAGIAWAIKLKKEKSHVWCWVGDMASETGVFYEALKYSKNFDLPITYIVEINEVSVLTPTRKVWGIESEYSEFENKYIIQYKYINKKYPHAGAGKRVQF